MKLSTSIPVLYTAGVLIGGLVTLLTYRTLPPEIPLLYSRSLSSEQVVPVWYISLLPAVATILIVCNSVLLKRLVMHEPVGLKIISVTNIVIIITTTVIYSRILLLVS